MRLLGSCGKTCGTTMNMIVCDLPSLDRLRKVGEADNYTMFRLSKINDGTILDIDYITEEEDADG